MSETDNPKCAICGKEFSPRVLNQKYCSPECSSAANKAGKRITSQTTRKIKNKTCLICGNPLTGRQLKFCCHDCAAEGAKREPAKVNRTYRYGKLRKKVLMYADIRRHNAANPIASGWRGHPCGGGAHPQTRYPMSI